MESKYLSQFEKVKSFRLRGNRVLIEPLPKEEIKTAGGLFVASSLSDHRSTTEQNRAVLAYVLAVGAGYYDDETKEDVGLDVAPGNIVLVSAFGMRAYSSFPGLVGYTQDSVALIRDSDVNAVWANSEAYDQYAKELASGASQKAES